jgi:hypothetical protein
LLDFARPGCDTSAWGGRDANAQYQHANSDADPHAVATAWGQSEPTPGGCRITRRIALRGERR